MKAGFKNKRFGDALMLGTFVVMLLAAAVLSFTQRAVQVRQPTVLIDGRVRVRVEVAATPASRELGLSGHAPLAPDQGMLFVFDHPDRYGFWMKDMRFPLDFLWIRDGVIIDITPDVPAPAASDSPLPAYYPREPADRVLEVPAGFAATNGISAGMTAVYQP